MKLYSRQQTAEMLGVSRDTLQKWAEDKLIPCIKLPNGRYRWTPEQVEEIKAGMYQPAATRAG